MPIDDSDQNQAHSRDEDANPSAAELSRADAIC